MKYLYAGGMSYEVYTKLIESVVEPVLFYCSGIWGTMHQTLLPGVIWGGYLLKLSKRLNCFSCGVS